MALVANVYIGKSYAWQGDRRIEVVRSRLRFWLSFALQAKAIVSLNGSDQAFTFLTALLPTSAHDTLLSKRIPRCERALRNGLSAWANRGVPSTSATAGLSGGDVGNLRYSGTYIEQGRRIKGTVTYMRQPAARL